MKQIFIHIQERLVAQVKSLKHVDKNWGQLNMPQPPVKFPCCLIDIDSVDYSQASDRCRLAEAVITLTVADQCAVRSSSRAPSKNDAYEVLDVLGSIIDALEGYRVPDTTQGITGTSIRKVFSDQSYDVYTISFSAAWVESPNKEGETAAASPSISVHFIGRS